MPVGASSTISPARMTATWCEDVADRREVVGDEQRSEGVLPLQILDKVEDLRLHGDVERADRLVEDDERGVCDECPRDAHPLKLAAGELVWSSCRERRLQPDVLEHGHCSVIDLRRAALVDEERFEHAGEDCGMRIKGPPWMLQDGLDSSGPRSQASREGGAFETHGAGVRALEAEHHCRCRRLARSGFADEA